MDIVVDEDDDFFDDPFIKHLQQRAKEYKKTPEYRMMKMMNALKLTKKRKWAKKRAQEAMERFRDTL